MTARVASEAANNAHMQVRARNRRKRYLELHPEYFGSALELQDPLLFHRLVREWYSSSEKERERQEKGFSGILEADLVRAEARLVSLCNAAPHSAALPSSIAGDLDDDADDDITQAERSRQSDYETWKAIMRRRFIAGDNKDFDYSSVDDNEIYDDSLEADMDRQDAYFDSQEPDAPLSGRLQMETGVQDF